MGGRRHAVRIRSVAALLAAAFVLTMASGGPALAASVTIGDNFYSPNSVTISVGQSVPWTYISGSTIHSVTADNGSFNSSPGCPGDVNACMHPGDSYSHTFSTAGTFSYHCLVHGFAMSGTVVVSGGGGSTPPPTGSSLPNTGASSSTGPFIWLGLLFLVAGGAVLFALRRRRA